MSEPKAVSKAEFVVLMVALAARDRKAYRVLRARGWAEAKSRQSESAIVRLTDPDAIA